MCVCVSTLSDVILKLFFIKITFSDRKSILHRLVDVRFAASHGDGLSTWCECADSRLRVSKWFGPHPHVHFLATTDGVGSGFVLLVFCRADVVCACWIVCVCV